MPRASVIITSHNRPHLLPSAIESAKMAGTDVEVIVVDDASTDGTANVCRDIEGIRYLRVERNQGVAAARNIGMLASKGEYITFLDDDDQRIAGSLDAQIEALSAQPQAGLVYAQALVVDQEGRLTGDYNPRRLPQGDVFWELLTKNFIPCGTALFRHSALLSAGLLDQRVPGIDDWDLWIRLSALTKVLAVERPVLLWRRSTPVSGQGTSNAVEIVKMSTRQFRRKWLRLKRAAQAPARQRREAWRRFSDNMARHLALETARAIKYGNHARAQKNLLAAISLYPFGTMRVALSPSTFRLALLKARNESVSPGQ